MDRLDRQMTDGIKQASMRNVLVNISSLRMRKDVEPRESVELRGRDNPRPGSERPAPGMPASPSGPQSPAPEASSPVAPAPGNIANVDAETMQSLLRDMPEEVLAAARQILKGQMKTRTEPTRALRTLKPAEGVGHLIEVLACTSIVYDIFDSSEPLLEE